MSDKVRENKLRRYAARLNLVIHKSRGKLWKFHDQMGYMIVDASTNMCLAGSDLDLDLDDVETWLKEYEISLH